MDGNRSKIAGGASAYRFALRPKWILSHLFVIALVVLMINLGFWQLRRLDQRRAFNDSVRTNATAQTVPLPSSLTSADVADLEWRPATVEGTYRRDQDVLVANRALEGQPGYWVVTPLDPADGSAPIPVVRGFVTRALVADGDLGQVTAPEGVVTVTGYVQKSRSGGRLAKGLAAGAAPEITAVDVPALGRQWGSDLEPLWLQLSNQQPAAGGDALTPVPLPTLDEGPHLSYAIQWFLFSTIAVIGYPLILRRNARARTAEAAETSAAAVGPPPEDPPRDAAPDQSPSQPSSKPQSVPNR